MRRSRSPHVSHVTRADDEGNGPPEVMCHMWMHERPPPCTPLTLMFGAFCPPEAGYVMGGNSSSSSISISSINGSHLW